MKKITFLLLSCANIAMFSNAQAMEESDTVETDPHSRVAVKAMESVEISKRRQNLLHQQELLSCKKLSYAELEDILVKLWYIGNKSNSKSSRKLLIYVNAIYPDLKITNDETRMGLHANEKKTWDVDLPISKFYQRRVKELNKIIEGALKDLN